MTILSTEEKLGVGKPLPPCCNDKTLEIVAKTGVSVLKVRI
jgi:hypothetical protein